LDAMVGKAVASTVASKVCINSAQATTKAMLRKWGADCGVVMERILAFVRALHTPRAQHHKRKARRSRAEAA
jgi:hypothetical protein